MKASILDLIEQYVEEQKNAWAPSTQRSERFRLRGLAEEITGDPKALWDFLVTNQKPYARVTAWTRVCGFWQWMIDRGVVNEARNPYQAFRREYARLFKNTYTRSVPELTIDEARERISKITAPDVKAKAEQLFDGGLRFAESKTVKDGHVVGKGGKRRRVAAAEIPNDNIAYHRFLRRLKKETGLKPHEIRKLVADALSRSGELEAQDLCEAMGWDDIKTAMSYLKPVQGDELMARIKKVTKQ